jgi:hypothetical protein
MPPAMTNGGACGDADEHLVSSEEELLRAAPLPHERVVYWGSGSPQGTKERLLHVDERTAHLRMI